MILGLEPGGFLMACIGSAIVIISAGVIATDGITKIIKIHHANKMEYLKFQVERDKARAALRAKEVKTGPSFKDLPVPSNDGMFHTASYTTTTETTEVPDKKKGGI